MPTAIVDGKGRGNLAEVDSKNRLQTLSVTKTLFHASTDISKAWSYSVSVTNPTAGDIVFAIKNTGPEELHLAGIVFMADAATWFRTFRGVNSDVFSGTTITPVNMNFASVNPIGAVAEAGNVTGVEPGDQIGEIFVSPSGTLGFSTQGVPRLGQNDIYYIEVDAGTPTRIGLDVLFLEGED